MGQRKREFKLTTDPHKCAFGKWYDQFHTDDLILTGLLRNFDEPHKAIHAIAHQVEQRKHAGDHEGAAALIETTRNRELAKLIDLFAAARSHLRTATREIAIVIEGSKEAFAIAVDRVESTERLEAGSVNELPGVMSGRSAELLRGIARRKKDQRMVLLLDADAVWGEATPPSAQAA